MEPYYEDREAGITLYCGRWEDVLPTLPRSSVGAIVIDPPYGSRRPSARRSADKRFKEVAGNDAIDHSWAKAAYEVAAPKSAIYSFCTWDTLAEWRTGIEGGGWRVRSCIVWDKGIHGLGDLATCWAPQHEMILFGAKGRHTFANGRPRDIISTRRISATKLCHPYEKPQALIEKILSTNTGPVLDFFMGSGATILAAKATGRPAIGIELEERYCALAEKRLRQKLLPFREEVPVATIPLLEQGLLPIMNAEIALG